MNLFGTEIIKSISFNEGEILNSINKLHCPDWFELDPCYSIGSFYKRFGIPQPKLKFDQRVQVGGVQKGDCRDLPLEDDSIKSIMFDPPFVIHGKQKTNVKKRSQLVFKRFTGFESWEELKSMYSDSLKEFYRILHSKGVLVFKCQDTVSGGKNHFTHCWVMNKAIEIGYYPKDLFILMAKQRMIGGNHKKQYHARKFHSYYWVLEKKDNKVNYK